MGKLLDQVKQLQDELGAERSKQAGAEAATLAAAADDGVVVVRRDGLDPAELRTLAIATRDALGSGIVAIVGLDADGDKAGLSVAVSKDRVESGASAAEIARDAAKVLGGGTAKHADVVQGGGPKVGAVDDALTLLDTAVRAETSARRKHARRHRVSRVLGVDLGSRRIGLAASDPSRVLASPHSTLDRAASVDDDHRAIVEAAKEVGAACIVVGLPRSLDGQLGPAARSALAEIEALRDLAQVEGVEVDTYDERFTTMIAQRNLRDANPRRGKRRAAQRDDIDASAAAVILQSWLDARPPRVTDTEGGGPDDPWPPQPPRRTESAAESAPPRTESASESATESPPRADSADSVSESPPRADSAESATESVRRRGDTGDGSRAPTRIAERGRRRRRRRTRAGVAIIAILVLPFVLVGGWFYWQLHPPGGQGATVSVKIEPGWGTKEAGDALQAQGVIGSSLAFQIWEKVSGGGSFQAGTYTLRESMGVSDASDALASGPSTAAANTDHTVLALPPGLRLEQIADRVGALPGHDRAAFLAVAQSGQIRSKYQGDQQSVEGFTWPDTYFVEGRTDAQILQTIVSEFDKHADAVNLGNPAATGLTAQQSVVVASLVQAEAGTAADAPKVAAVITNRLKQQTCRCRSTPPSATPRAAARRCRATPTSRSIRPTTPTGSTVCRPRRS